MGDLKRSLTYILAPLSHLIGGGRASFSVCVGGGGGGGQSLQMTSAVTE